MSGFKRLPQQRKNSNTLNAFTSLNFDVKVPNGYKLVGIDVQVKVNATGAPDPATTRLSKIFKSFRVRNPAGPVCSIRNGDALPMACVISQALKETQIYPVSPRSTEVALNPAIAAAATDYFGSFKLFTPFPGNVFSIVAELAQLKTQFPGITAISVDIGIVALVAEESEMMDRYVLFADEVNKSSQSYRNVEKGGFYCANNLTGESGANSLTFGESIGGSEIGVMQDDFSQQLRGLASNAAAVAGIATPVKDPATDSAVYGVLGDLKGGPGIVSVEMANQQDIGFVLFLRRSLGSVGE